MNPGGVILIVAGIFMVLIGVRGSESSVFAAITGQTAGTSSTTSRTDFSAANGATIQPALAAMQSTPAAPATGYQPGGSNPGFA